MKCTILSAVLFSPLISEAWLGNRNVLRLNPITHAASSPLSSSRIPLRIFQSSSYEAEAQELREKAEQLRKEIETLETSKKDAEVAELKTLYAEQTVIEARRQRYSAVVPILKPDGSTVEERCDFTPRWKEEGTSYIMTLAAPLPLGILLGESEEFAGTIVVDEVVEGSNGELARVKEGDLIRAFTACKMEMELPTWQLIAGGIGRPKTVRFMYSADNRPFEEVMDAVGSNRMDPDERAVILVVERREGLS
jgi:hypothetical protein